MFTYVQFKHNLKYLLMQLKSVLKIGRHLWKLPGKLLVVCHYYWPLHKMHLYYNGYLYSWCMWVLVNSNSR
jgi:hypothetical protein